MTVRVAVLGCGAATRTLHLPGARAAGFEVTGFWSRTRSSAEAAAGEWGSGTVFDSADEALDPARADAVIVATPNALHADLAIRAAKGGLHALVEKPMATTLDDADAMIAAADAAGTVLMIAQTARFAPPVAAVRAAVRGGAIGELRSVRATLRNQGPDAWSPGAAWFAEPDLSGGGALMDLGVHLADAIRAITGSEARAVAAMCRPAPPIDVDAQAVLTLDGGVIASMHAGWDAPVADFSLTVSGSEAIAHADGLAGAVLIRGDGVAEPLPEPVADDQWSAFARAVSGLEQPAVTGDDGRAALAIVLAAYRSIETSMPVPVGS